MEIVSQSKTDIKLVASVNVIKFLFAKAIFRDGIASQFISTLLNVLTNGSHELLREEIGLAIYAMASPDFEAFFQQLLPNYLLSCQGVEDHQKMALKSGFTNDTVKIFIRDFKNLVSTLFSLLTILYPFCL